MVVTHWHYDHAFGLAAFADLATIGARVRARAARLAGGRRRGGPAGVDADGAGRADRELVVATAVDLGGRRVEIAHLGRGHTDGDLVVVVPDADVVFAGDLIESAGPPSFGAGLGARTSGPATLDGLIGLMTAKHRAVPGHGDPVDREFVFEQRGRVAAWPARSAGWRDWPSRSTTPRSAGTGRSPFAAVRPGLAAGFAQARAAAGPRRPTLPLA